MLMVARVRALLLQRAPPARGRRREVNQWTLENEKTGMGVGTRRPRQIFRRGWSFSAYQRIERTNWERLGTIFQVFPKIKFEDIRIESC
jgi:hypothetical protein